MTVLVDMDDVIENLVPAWVNFLNEKYECNVTLDDIKSWDITEAFPGLSAEQIFEAPSSDDFWKTVIPLPGAVEGLKTLIDENHDVYIVTATWYGTLKAKMEYVLFKYFPFIKWDKVIITSNKQLVKGDVLIDDGPHNLIGGDYKKILFDAPHNRSFDEKSIGAVRVHNWEETISEIRRIS